MEKRMFKNAADCIIEPYYLRPADTEFEYLTDPNPAI